MTALCRMQGQKSPLPPPPQKKKKKHEDQEDQGTPTDSTSFCKPLQKCSLQHRRTDVCQVSSAASAGIQAPPATPSAAAGFQTRVRVPKIKNKKHQKHQV